VKRLLTTLATAALLATPSTALATELSDTTGAQPFTPDGTVDVAHVKKLLDDTPTTAPEPTSEYNRVTHFGKAWKDTDNNNCDTRNDILGRDLTSLDYAEEPGQQNAGKGEPSCPDATIYAGTLNDPYTGKTIRFTRGVKTSLDVHIDHMVPLKYAWEAGAHTWTQQRREAFANDPINLTAVDGKANSGKGDRGPAEWMPPNTAYECMYVARFTYVAHTYSLAVSEADKNTIRDTLTRCEQPPTTPTVTPKPQPTSDPAPAGMTLTHTKISAEDYVNTGVTATITGLQPGEKAGVKITMPKFTQYTHPASATYVANDRGVVTVNIRAIGAAVPGTVTVSVKSDSLTTHGSFTVTGDEMSAPINVVAPTTTKAHDDRHSPSSSSSSRGENTSDTSARAGEKSSTARSTGSDILPVTGAQAPTWLGLVGLGMIAAGVALFAISARRNRTTHSDTNQDSEE